VTALARRLEVAIGDARAAAVAFARADYADIALDAAARAADARVKELLAEVATTDDMTGKG
jgi:hypothetical protein